jgi:predicted dienelactone hydrolase
MPLVVFSHGLGGSREGYGFIGEHLASHGYIVVLPTHAGSDTKAMSEVMRGRVRDRVAGGAAEGKAREGPIAESTSDPDNLRDRPRDISFVINQVSKDERLKGLVDLDRIAVAGHSFGAYTAMAVAGMVVEVPAEKGKAGGEGDRTGRGPAPRSFRDPRVKVAIAMSPQGQGMMGVRRGAWDPIRIPVLMLTGTKDYGQGARSAAWRREAFDAIKGAEEWLVTLEGATHMTFADGGRTRLLRAQGPKDERDRHREEVLAVTTAFLDGYLMNEKPAREWMTGTLEGKKEGWVAEHKLPAGDAKPESGR